MLSPSTITNEYDTSATNYSFLLQIILRSIVTTNLGYWKKYFPKSASVRLLVGRLVGQLVGRSVVRLFSWLVGWLVDWLVGCFFLGRWLVGWLVGRSVGQMFFHNFMFHFPC